MARGGHFEQHRVMPQASCSVANRPLSSVEHRAHGRKAGPRYPASGSEKSWRLPKASWAPIRSPKPSQSGVAAPPSIRTRQPDAVSRNSGTPFLEAAKPSEASLSPHEPDPCCRPENDLLTMSRQKMWETFRVIEARSSGSAGPGVIVAQSATRAPPSSVQYCRRATRPRVRLLPGLQY